jgi:hypothetical protein
MRHDLALDKKLQEESHRKMSKTEHHGDSATDPTQPDGSSPDRVAPDWPESKDEAEPHIRPGPALFVNDTWDFIQGSGKVAGWSLAGLNWLEGQ